VYTGFQKKEEKKYNVCYCVSLRVDLAKEIKDFGMNSFVL